LNTEIKGIKNNSNQISVVLNRKQSAGLITREVIGSPFSIIEQHFSQLVGMEHMRQSLREIYAIEQINKRREAQHLKSSKQVYHMLFSGNPGTGKTTVARKLANIFYEIGVLPKNHIIEVDRSELVGEYIGQTAQKTKAIIKKALGGILFIDEAYSLARGGEKDFGKEAIDTLVKFMEDYSTQFILILAGYPKEMEYFLSLNPGLESRFPFIFNFPNYTELELLNIAKKFLDTKDYVLSKEAERVLITRIKKEKMSNRDFSNGRYVRNIIESAIRNHAVRLMYENKNHDHKQLSLIIHQDLACL